MSKRILKMGWIVLIALLSLSLAILPACGGGGGAVTPYKNDGQFIQMTIGDAESLDPAWGYDNASGEQVQYIYETLIYYNGASTDTFVPVLATEVPAFNSTDLTYRFEIREGITFQLGGNLTPEDVEYSFERAMVQDRPGGPIWMFFQPFFGQWSSDDVTFAEIDGAVEVDGDDVVFTLVGAYWQLPFLQIMCGAWASIVDKEWCIAQGDWDGTEETWLDYNHPTEPGDTVLFDITNGTGRWKLNLWDQGVQIKLEKNTSYWGGSVPFDWVITKIETEWSNRKLALVNGDADHVYVPRMYITQLEDYADLLVKKDLPELSIDAFFFNMAIAANSTYIGTGALDGHGIPTNFFTDINVRKGFCSAFDYNTYIQDAMLNEAEQRGSPVVEGLYGYNPDASMYSYNLTVAANYLHLAYNGTLWDTGFEFTVLYNSGNVPRKTACEILAERLYAINPKFTVKIQPLAWPTILGKIFGTRDMPMFQIGWLPDYPHADNFVVPFMHSQGTFAYFQGYGNSTIDAKIAAAFQDTNPVTQQQKYNELQEIYYQDAPGIMLVQPLGRRYFTKYISGFFFHPCIYGQAGPLWDMSKSES